MYATESGLDCNMTLQGVSPLCSEWLWDGLNSNRPVELCEKPAKDRDCSIAQHPHGHRGAQADKKGL